MKNKIAPTIAIGFIICFLFLSFASAAQPTLGTVTQYDCINLLQTCVDCSYNNISFVSYPNRTIKVLEDVSMTKNGIIFNYTFCLTSELGTYIVNGYGDPDGTKTSWNYDFIVTTTGESSNNTIPVFLLISAIILLVMALAIKSPPLGFFSGILFMMVGMYLMIYGFGFVADLYTQSFALVVIGMGVIMSILAGYSWMDDD